MTTAIEAGRGRPQRRAIPDAAHVQDAIALARRRARLRAQLAENHAAQLEVVLSLRALGLSVQECAELLDLSKGRVQQMAHEAHDAKVPHDSARCPYPQYH